MCALRLDTNAVCKGLGNEDQLINECVAGGKMCNPADFRTSVITFTGLYEAPAIYASASDGEKGRTEWNEAAKTLTLTVIANGETRITLER